MDLYNSNTNKELYYYFVFVHYFLILFFVLGIIIIYKNGIIHQLLILVIIIIFIIVLFIQNRAILQCFYNKSIKEGWKDVHCFRLYSEYANAQAEIDKIDVAYNIVLNDITTNLASMFAEQQNKYVNLDNEISTLLHNFATNLSNVAETNNAWNSQYATTLQSMNNMTNSLYNIQRNLDPTQYSVSYKRV